MARLAASTQPSTATGQIRRTSSGAADRNSASASSHGCSLAGTVPLPLWYASGSPATAAIRATSTSSTQRPAVRFAGCPAAPIGLMLDYSPPVLPRSGVDASQPQGGGGDEDDGVPAEHREPGPRRQRVGDAPRPAPQSLARVRGQVLGQVVADRGGQQAGERRDHEEDAREGGDAGRGVAEQRAEGDADHPRDGHVQGGADDRAQGSGG